MLVSGGQILAIDKVYTDQTLTGDGVKQLGVNTEIIATTELVSGTSAILHDEISAVSAKMHETEVSGDNTTIVVNRKVKEDGKTVVYEVSATPQAAIVLHGINGISAESVTDGWNISYTGQQGNIYSAHADGRDHMRIYQEDGQWYLSAYVPDTSKFITSADDTLVGKALVLKDNVWIEADFATKEDIDSLSSTVANTYLSASEFNTYSAKLENRVSAVEQTAADYKALSSYYYEAAETVSSYSAYWNEVSSFSANSGLFMERSKIEYAPDSEIITGYDGSAFGDKDTNYVGVDGIKVNKDTFEIGISANFLSANALDDLSGKWEDVYNTVNEASGRWDAHSALSASKLDASESAKFMKLEDLKGTEAGEISGYGESAFYYPPFPDIPKYTGDNGIEVTDEYVIKLSAEFLSASDKYLSASDKYLSANALDDLSGKWEDAADTVSSYSAAWNESSAFSAASGKFVTSAGVEFDENLAYFIKNTAGEVVWSGVDLSDLGKMYQISSLTPDLISATISAIDGVSAYVLSAAKPEEITQRKINGEYCEVDYNDEYYLITGAKIKCENGLSAKYSETNNEWTIGISANDYAYLHGTYSVQAEVQANTIVKFDSGSQYNITIDEDGYIHLPDTGNKFTFCINETVENNISNAHAYNLNKIALVETDGTTESTIVSTQDYYPTEVGSSDTNIAITITHNANNKYAVKYLGSTIPDTVNLNLVISIIEEISSLATTEGGGHTYAGVEPVWVNNQANTIGLAYDREQFKVVPGMDTEHPELSALQINIQTTGGDINQEAFEKMANLIYGRLTETIPIGLVNSHESLGNGGAFSYLFRPTMEFDVSSGTVARIMTLNGTVGASKAQVAISELNEDNANVTIMWWSEIKTLTAQAGTLTLSANPGCTDTRTLYPDRLYYATIINRDQQTQYVGFKNEFLTDAGDYDVAYWDEHSTNNDRFAGNLPGTLNDIPASDLGQTGGAKLKPYIAFRNEK